MFRLSLNQLASGRSERKRKARDARVGLESLEDRELLTAPVVIPTPPWLRHAPADLDLVSLNVQDLGNSKFHLTATLRNGPPGTFSLLGDTYPGGGVLQITRSTGGTILYGPPDGQPSLFGLADFDRGQVIASMPIPRLGYGQSIQVSTITTGRALFTAAAVPVFDPDRLSAPPLPEANPNNDSLTVDNLIKSTIPVNTTTLGLFPLIKDAQIVLDRDNSMFSIPGLGVGSFDHFSIPGKDVSIPTGLFGDITVTYYVNNLRATSVALSYEQGGLAIDVTFADNQHALHTPSIFPDISVKDFEIKIFLPLSYDSIYQYFSFHQPRVQVNGDWSANGLFGPAFNLLLPDMKQKVSEALTEKLNEMVGDLSFQFTKQIHDMTKGGRIDGADIQQNQMNLTVETPQPLF